MLRKDLAKTGERLAAEYLAKQGYLPIQMNFKSPFGEIDLIALDNISQDIVIVEVKTRTGDNQKAAKNCVSLSKRKKLALTALYFISNNKQYSHHSIRFDVFIIMYHPRDDDFSIEHLKHAFVAGDIISNTN